MYQKLTCPIISYKDLIDLSAEFSEIEGTCLLFSGGAYETARHSFLCLFPYESVRVEQFQTTYKSAEGQKIYTVDNPWEGLKKVIHFGDSHSELPEWIGYFAYEMGAFSDEEKRLPYQSSGIPDAYFFRPSVVIKVDHVTLISTLYLREEAIPFLTDRQRDWLNHLTIDPPAPVRPSELFFAAPDQSLDTYLSKVDKAKELIFSGDIYQVNLSQKFCLRGSASPVQLFRNVSLLNPAPFMGLLTFPGFTIVSTSPERFLQKTGSMLQTRPIKGTVPRGKTEMEDEKNKMLLLTSMKERAELLMITDLMRNDLGKVSVPGSVVTDKIWHLEAYKNVFHLSSWIHSHVKAGMDPIDIVRSAFPAGSITGCPKLRAMEVIGDLEMSPRGVYTGSIGYFAGNGDFDFNVAIRTLLWKKDGIELRLGGAIVADSDPQKEYEEILHKGESIFKALNLEN